MDITQVKKRISAVSASNRNALYASNLYWSQKPYNICDILIEAFSERGDVVYDPFLGSGVTLLEAIKEDMGRVGVGCEINEAPVFIVETLLKSYDRKGYRAAAKTFVAGLEALLPYYHTECPECGGDAVVTKVLFDKQSREAEPEIKQVQYRCACGSKGEKAPCAADYAAMNVQEEIRFIDDSEYLIPNTRLAVYENQRISQIFTPRNFVVLDRVLGLIEEQAEYRDIFRYILLSVLHLCKITDKHSNSQWPLWIPKTGCVEKNVVDLLKKKVKKFKDTIEYLEQNYTADKRYRLLHKGSQHVTQADIPNGSVQLIITDPPYLGQVAYSEYMQLYKPFLGLGFNLEDEIVVSTAPSRDKKQEEYFAQLGQVFSLCGEKVRDGGYMCMYFHDCGLDVWDKLIAMLARSGFRYLSQVHIKKSNTVKNIISPKKSLNGDAVLFFVKDTPREPVCAAETTIEEMERDIAKGIRDEIARTGPKSTPEMYDGGLMEHIINKGWLPRLAQEYKTLVDIFEKYLTWDASAGKWQ